MPNFQIVDDPIKKCLLTSSHIAKRSLTVSRYGPKCQNHKLTLTGAIAVLTAYIHDAFIAANFTYPNFYSLPKQFKKLICLKEGFEPFFILDLESSLIG